MARDYYQFTVDEFEEFLDELAGGKWHRVDKITDDEYKQFNREIVYEIELKGTTTLALRVFSSIDKRSGKARDKGDDSIKSVIWSKEVNRPIAGKSYTQRIRTWQKNLAKKLDKLYREWNDAVEKCSECGNWMVKREGEYGEFWGCTGYPDCENTKQCQGG